MRHPRRGFADRLSATRRTAGLLIVAACVALGTAEAGSGEEAIPSVVVQQGGRLYAIAVDGSRRVRLARVSPLSAPSVSPDGSSVAFVRTNGGISTMRLDGSDRRIVTRDGGSPAWSPEGTTLYLVKSRPNRFDEYCGSIFAVPSSGGSVRRVTNSRPTGHSHHEPAVSPDGARVAFSDWDMCGGGTARPRLRVVDVRGRPTGDLARLRRNGYDYGDPERAGAAWSPDGERIAYRWNWADLAVANRDGSVERRIVHGPRFSLYGPPTWSHDGNWIAFARETRLRSSALFVVHPDGTGLRRLARAPNFSLAGWLRSLPG